MTGGAPDAKLLEVSDVVVRFGGIMALDGVSFDLEEGQILGLIGPERCRQDDAVQLPQPSLHAGQR